MKNPVHITAHPNHIMGRKSGHAHKQIGRRGIKNLVHITKHPDYIMGRRSSRAHKPTEKFKGFFLTHIGSHSLVKGEEQTNRELSDFNLEEKSNSKSDDSLSIVSKSCIDKNVLEDMTEEILNQEILTQDEALTSVTKYSCNSTDVNFFVGENYEACGNPKKRKYDESLYENANLGSVCNESSKSDIMVQSIIQHDSINDFTYQKSFAEVTSEKELQDIEQPLKIYRNLAEKRKRSENESFGIFEESCRKKKKNLVGDLNTEENSPLKSRGHVANISKTTMDELTDLPIDGEKEGRPPYSYSKLIVQAITSVPKQQMTLDDIYIYIKQNHPYYQKSTEAEWQTRVRNNLLTPYFMRVENSYVTGKGYLWKMDPNFSEKLMDQAFKVRNDGDITNQNICSQSSFSTKYLPKEKVRKINKSPKMTTPESYTVSQNSNGNELQLKLKLKPLKASDITETFLKDHHIRTQSREKLKIMLSRKSTRRKGRRKRKLSQKLQDYVVSEWNGNMVEVASNLEKTEFKNSQSQISSERSKMNDNNLEEITYKTELTNGNSSDRSSLMSIPNFRIPAKCMSETRIRALSISPPHTPIKATSCRASACFEKVVEGSNNEHNVESESSASISESLDLKGTGDEDKIYKVKDHRDKKKSIKSPYEPNMKSPKTNELSKKDSISEFFDDKSVDEFKISKVKDHIDEKKINKSHSKHSMKSSKISKLTKKDNLSSGENSFTHKTDRKKLKDIHSNFTNADLCLDQNFTSPKNVDVDLGSHKREQQKIKISRKHESNTDIKSINKTPEFRVQETAAAFERRSERVPKPTEKLIDFIVSKGKIHCNTNSITEEENIRAKESNSILKEKESKDLPTYSEDEFKSHKLSKINLKASITVDVLEVSNSEKKSRRKQPPNTIRKITTDGSVPGNADGYKPEQKRGRIPKTPKRFNEFITGYPLCEVKTVNQVSPTVTENVKKVDRITNVCAKSDISKNIQKDIKKQGTLITHNTSSIDFLRRKRSNPSFTKNSNKLDSKKLTRNKKSNNTSLISTDKNSKSSNNGKIPRKIDKIYFKEKITKKIDNKSNTQIPSDNVINNSKEHYKREVNKFESMLYICTECKESFNNRRELKRHTISHKLLTIYKLKGRTLTQISQ